MLRSVTIYENAGVCIDLIEDASGLFSIESDYNGEGIFGVINIEEKRVFISALKVIKYIEAFFGKEIEVPKREILAFIG